MGDQTVDSSRAPTGRMGLQHAWPWLVTAGMLLAGCEEPPDPSQAAAPPPPAVAVVEVQRQPVTPSVSFTGRVVAIDRVDLLARVTGFLEQRLFMEGQDVSKGDLLFVIEQAPFEAEVARAEAEVARAEASLAEAEATLARVQEAVRSGAVSKQELDQATAAEAVARAEVLAAQAELKTARLNLSYTKIEAPIAGRIGRSNYTVGNLVGPDSGVLATIVSQDPIYVTFPVSTRVLLGARRRAARAAELVVRAQLPDGTMYKHPGKIDFADIEVDETTDTIIIRAEFPNPERLLVVGQFVNVFVEAEQPRQEIVITQSALQVDQAGQYVLTVNDESTVEQRRVETGQAQDGRVVIASGLNEGDRVIVEGLQKVRPGQQVQATVVPAPAPTGVARAGSEQAPPAGARQPAAEGEGAPPAGGEPGAARSRTEAAPPAGASARERPAEGDAAPPPAAEPGAAATGTQEEQAPQSGQ
jgi:membrane fusion protein, multidrug efflux system